MAMFAGVVEDGLVGAVLDSVDAWLIATALPVPWEECFLRYPPPVGVCLTRTRSFVLILTYST
jgi:hypothetical protein